MTTTRRRRSAPRTPRSAHEPRQPRVDVHHLLKLVEHERDRALALGAELSRQLEQAFDRVVDVRLLVRGPKAEAQGRVVGVELDGGADAQPAEDLRGPLEGVSHRGSDVLVDRPREVGGEPLLRRGLHDVAVGDERVVAHRILGRAEDE